MIEKHFTLRRSDGGVDSTFSLEPHEFECLVTESKRAWLSMDMFVMAQQRQRKKAAFFRRSIYVSSDIAEGNYLPIII